MSCFFRTRWSVLLLSVQTANTQERHIVKIKCEVREGDRECFLEYKWQYTLRTVLQLRVYFTDINNSSNTLCRIVYIWGVKNRVATCRYTVSIQLRSPKTKFHLFYACFLFDSSDYSSSREKSSFGGSASLPSQGLTVAMFNSPEIAAIRSLRRHHLE